MLSMRFILLYFSLLWNFNKRPDPISRFDEDITPLDANNIPGPRARARELNLEVSSFLKPSFYTFDKRLLPNDYIVIRNKGEDQNMHRKGLGGVEVQQEGARHGGDPNQVDFESVSESRNSLS
jgi:hypothetical protein